MKKTTVVAFVILLASQVFAQRDYPKLQDMLVKFYGYQRAGLASGSCANLNAGFTNASHNGDSYNGHPLDGGWYDAGDYIKFGMNLSYSLYCLLKGYDFFPGGYANNYAWNYTGTDKIPDILNEAKFATDYLIKAVIDENTIVLDVGIASEEHDSWGVVNAGGRSGNKIVLCTGADIPATYAACLALMSTLYRKYDVTYANQCLAKAKTAFNFARKKVDLGGDNNLFCVAQEDNGLAPYDYSKTDGKYTTVRRMEDRMVAAGVELYRATDDADPIYKTWAKKNIPAVYNCMGFSFVGPLASIETWRQGLGSAASLSNNIGFIEGMVQTTAPFEKVFVNNGWGTARNIGTAAFEYALAYVITQSETARVKYLQRVKDHVDWVAGYIGTKSYVCGFGPNAPTKIHYRTPQFGPVPGGVVGGPDEAGNWENDGSPKYCEVAIDYNAGIIGAIAFLKALENPGTDIKVTSAFAATPKSGVDFNKTTVAFSATFSSSVKWTIKITGANGSKTISKTGTSISEVWDGSADRGMFLGGETVSAALTVDGNIAVYDILKTNSISIGIAQAKKPVSMTGDVLIDNFEDSNLANQHGGNWVPFGTRTDLGRTSTSFKIDSGSNALVISGSVATSDNKNNAGVKATFNSTGAPVSVGPIKSVLFDLRGNKSVNVRVELEQSTITDGAFYSSEILITPVLNRYRLNVADFTQPEWKTSAKTLDLSNISALRFTVYDSIGPVYLYLDNVWIENLSTRVISVTSKSIRSALKPVISNGVLAYNIPQNITGLLDVAVYNISGKEVLKQSLNAGVGKAISISLSTLPAGMYTVCNSVNGAVVGSKIKFVNTK